MRSSKNNNDTLIRYHPELNGVEIRFEGEHFVLESSPTMIGRLETADKFSNLLSGRVLPSVRQALIIRRFLREINCEFRKTGGFVIEKECILWTDDYMFKDCSIHVEEGVVVPLMGGKPYISGYSRHEYRLVRPMR